MKLKIVILYILVSTITVSAQKNYWDSYNNKAIVRTYIVMQNWQLDGIEDALTEGTLPVEIIYPVNDKISLQLFNSPVLSSFGDYQLNGLSDTYLKGTYGFYNKKMVLSAGIGIPTGKTNLSKEEIIMTAMLSHNVFRFRMPVLGQGTSVNIGYAAAHSINPKLAIGGGFNFIYQGAYKFANYDFNPGNQFSMNFGIDWIAMTPLKISFDVIGTFYSDDQINDARYSYAPKYGALLNIFYTNRENLIWIIGKMRKKSKCETSFGTTLIPDSTNSNILQMELEATYRRYFTTNFMVDLIFDGRSYIENEYRLGQADIFGGGVRANYKVSPKFEVNSMVKFFVGDTYFRQTKTIQKVNGFELSIGSIYYL